ncbi:hypothetical protein [Haloarcula amylovorans]|uniref:hypothetical protein n=1 Tax=Haloarcula amylovorans TaxID=2562280 RepID=UPI0010764318|nr:hypothetical protein [Halomicroarcula amylolytica]
MPARTKRIAVSESEKDRLKDVAEDVFGESDTIPYGVTVSYLIDRYEDNSGESKIENQPTE